MSSGSSRVITGQMVEIDPVSSRDVSSMATRSHRLYVGIFEYFSDLFISVTGALKKFPFTIGVESQNGRS